MRPFLYMVSNNLALYQFLALHYYGKIEGNKYLHFETLSIWCHFENRTPQTKPSSKERVMKISKCFQPQLFWTYKHSGEL